MSPLPFAHGGPSLRAQMRARPEDFFVDEQLGLQASGAGEHVLVRVEKRNTNTDWLAGQLADFAGIKRNAVSYAGLKDRHAVTRQTFSLHLPGVDTPDWSQLQLPEITILDSQRHHRKLKRGSLTGNLFRITLTAVEGDQTLAEQQLQAIRTQGVPNYFGEQRFGREGQNTRRAIEFFQGKRIPRKQQGMLISAARSLIFNEILAQRVRDNSWQNILLGDACCLNGSRSWFLAEEDLAALQSRVDAFDIHPSGPLWGSDALATQAEVAELEHGIAKQHPELKQGLEKQRMDHDRRPLRVRPEDMNWQWLDADRLELSFGLPAGCYATTILRELAHWSE